jgi:hypothetical protein
MSEIEDRQLQRLILVHMNSRQRKARGGHAEWMKYIFGTGMVI